MAGVKAIRDAIKTTVGAAVATLHVYDTVPEVVNLPALVVMPAKSDFVSMGRGVDSHTFQLYLLAASGRDTDLAQDELDDFVTSFGSSSIRQAVWNTRTLGLANTDAHVSGMSQYGGRFETAQVEHVGAVLDLIVHTTGTA